MARLNHARDELLAAESSGGRTGSTEPATGPHRTAGRPQRPSWATAHEAAWTDYWSAWNELPRREPAESQGSSVSASEGNAGTN
jgi:hypothetical protein